MPRRRKTFLAWIASPEFATLYSQCAAGLLLAVERQGRAQGPVAQEFVGWRETCKSTIRNSYQILSRGTPNLENELWNVSSQVINGTMTPDGRRQEAGGRPGQLVPARSKP